MIKVYSYLKKKNRIKQDEENKEGGELDISSPLTGVLAPQYKFHFHPKENINEKYMTHDKVAGRWDGAATQALCVDLTFAHDLI